MGHIQVTVKVAKPNINSKMGVTVTKTGPSAVFVSDLKPGFCGQQAGLMFNDIILQVNGENVETPVQCTDLFKVAKPNINSSRRWARDGSKVCFLGCIKL